jgi:hypothetical protein
LGRSPLDKELARLIDRYESELHEVECRHAAAVAAAYRKHGDKDSERLYLQKLGELRAAHAARLR